VVNSEVKFLIKAHPSGRTVAAKFNGGNLELVKAIGGSVPSGYLPQWNVRCEGASGYLCGTNSGYIEGL
jgi:hypothetical protein